MFRNLFNPERERYIKMYGAKSLGELEKHRLMFARGIEDNEREIKLLKAQISGLTRSRPEGFGGKAEELEAKRKKLQSAVDTYKVQLAAIKEVIAQKSRRR